MSAEKIHPHRLSLRLFNNYLTVLVAILAIYIILIPFLPQFGWWVKHDSPVAAILPPKPNPTVVPKPAPVVQGDTLFIPRLDMQKSIFGGGKANLHKGVWHVPHTSTPDKGGNTVLVGHRFTYKDPTGAVFYHLDKVQKDDAISVQWQGKMYNYHVTDIKVVPDTELSVQDNTSDPQLTIYTCTPLWSVTHRLVIVAKPTGVDL